MNTSTHLSSPLRKRFSTKKNLIEIEPTEDEFENELKNRRLEAINKSTELKRRSVVAPLSTGLNAAQLAQHCTDCIKLSSANKINSKNAFSLLLIDFMAAMTKKGDSEISQNLQVASSTLDASVKIYGYRVDAVHADVIKIAGGLFSREEQEELGEVDEETGDVKQEVKTKVKKKKKKVTVVASSSLNAKSESEALLDVVPKMTLLARNNEGSKLLTRVPKYNDGCLLMAEADVPCWSIESTTFQPVSFGDDCDPENVLSVLKNLSVCVGDRICSDVSNVVFEQDVTDMDDGHLNASQTSAFEFDINASVAEVDYDEEEGPQRLAVPAGGFDSGDDIVAPLPPPRSAPASITDMKRRLSVQNMEYSMFDDKVMKAWAGPTYWKIRPSYVNNSENKENEEACQGGGAKRTRRGRPKELVELFHLPDDVLQKHLTPAAKGVLAKSTLCSWKASAVTLSEDYKYKPQDLFTLFHIPLSVTSLDTTQMVIEDDLIVDEPQNVDELDYYSSQIPIGDDDDDDEVPNSSKADVDVWDDGNMVAVPNKVGKIAVTGLHRRKHVDMKHLKKCIWDLLCLPKQATDGFTFQKLLETCPSRLPKTIAACITTPMLFNALLHLTNEKSLTLLQPEKKADFRISL